MSATALVAAPQPAVRRAVWAHGPRDLEARLVAEAHAPAALRRALARVAARMVAMRGWERLGWARSGDYAVEQVGISGRELRELAAVGAALEKLSALDTAFRVGEIGWTQLRLLTRVATPQNQEDWLALARGLTALALAREVRAVDRQPVVRAEDEERVGVVLRLTRRARARWWGARQIANRIAGQVLSHGAFAEVLAAEVLSAVPLDSVGGPEIESGAGESSLPRNSLSSARCAGWRVSPALPDSEVAALEQGLEDCDAFELDQRLRNAVQMEARGLARVAARLHDVVAWGLHRDLGFRSVDAYAEERLGMAPSRARALLRIDRAARVCPALRDAFASGRLSWVQAYALVPLLLEPAVGRYRKDWVEHAQRVTVRRLGDDVECALSLGEFAPPRLDSSREPIDPDPDPAGRQTGANTRLEKESERLVFTAVPEVAQLFRTVLATVQRRLERGRGRPCNPSDALEAMLDHALATWRPKQRVPRDHLVFERDGWRCTVPGCTSYRNLQQHHVLFHSAGGSDDRSNLTTLCAWHHLRGVHARVMRCTGIAPDGLRFELGMRSNGPPLAVYRSGDIHMEH